MARVSSLDTGSFLGRDQRVAALGTVHSAHRVGILSTPHRRLQGVFVDDSGANAGKCR
jgi:hypothetical protein